VRWKGIKGMISFKPDIKDNQIVLRKSMNKFENIDECMYIQD